MERMVMGIDVSKEELDYCIYDGRTYRQGAMLNQVESIRQTFKSYAAVRDRLQIVMEATGTYHLKLCSLLLGRGFRLSVVNPLIIKRYSEAKMLRAKTDPVDARLISIYGYEQQPALWKPRSIQQRKMIAMLRAVEDLIQTRTDYERRLEALAQIPEAPGIIKRSYCQLIRTLNRKAEQLDQMTLAIAQSQFQEDYQRLVSIDSVGAKTAVIMLAYFGHFEEFESSKQLVSYIGTNPSPRQSGNSVQGRGCISKKGNPYIRKQLFMTSLSAVQHNPACRDFYRHLRENGKEHKVARIAVVNKLVRQIYAVVKYNRNYDPNYAFKS